jgi:hypothetical protein
MDKNLRERIDDAEGERIWREKEGKRLVALGILEEKHLEMFINNTGLVNVGDWLIEETRMLAAEGTITEEERLKREREVMDLKKEPRARPATREEFQIAWAKVKKFYASHRKFIRSNWNKK